MFPWYENSVTRAWLNTRLQLVLVDSLFRRIQSSLKDTFFMSWKHNVLSKQCFQRKTCPPTANWVGMHAYCSLLCHNDTSWIPPIISKESMHIHNFGQTLKLQSAVVTLNIRRRSSKSNLLPPFQQCLYASLVEKDPLVQNTELRKGWIYFF